MGDARTEGLRIVTSAAFQQLDVDYYLGPPDPKVQKTELTEVPILRMYGVSEAGDLTHTPTKLP